MVRHPLEHFFQEAQYVGRKTETFVGEAVKPCKKREKYQNREIQSLKKEIGT
jgi:hypothetical protein